ncbi:MAG: hypothetical protein IJZ29_04775 [Clostridia bacterium]|nr:hypothetical protein [Clostridia bacterium]
MIKEYNVKDDFPPVDVAVANVESEIEVNKKFGDNIIKIIHGYGSHGVGGAIRLALRERLKELKQKHIIVDYIIGERFTTTLVNNLKINSNLKAELLLDYNINSFNSGITIIIIKDKK